MKKVLVLTIIATTFSMFCERNNEKPEIKIGDYSDMLIKTYDTIIIGGYNKKEYYDFDINNDKINDFRFISEVPGSPGLGSNPYSKIQCLNEFNQIFGYYRNDTCFKHTSIGIDSSSSTISVYIYYNFSCHRIDETDSICNISYSQFNIIPLEKDYVLKKTDIFESGTYTMITDDYSYPIKTYNWGEDTVTYVLFSFNSDCNAIPLDQIVYLGVKIDESDEEKLGWIKVSIFEKYKILILESAIQD